MKTIFSNLDLILGVNVELLNKIEEKFADWSDDSTLGDVFVQLVSTFFFLSSAENFRHPSSKCTMTMEITTTMLLLSITNT